MESEKIDLVLKEVIRKAREINIPVPDIISDKVIVNKRPKKRFGCCRKKDGMFFIEISEFILKCSDKKIEEVIAHEVLHTCPGCYEYGKKWKEFADNMNRKYGYNIKRTSTFEEMGIEEDRGGEDIKYIISVISAERISEKKVHLCYAEDKCLQVCLRRETDADHIGKRRPC